MGKKNEPSKEVRLVHSSGLSRENESKQEIDYGHLGQEDPPIPCMPAKIALNILCEKIAPHSASAAFHIQCLFFTRKCHSVLQTQPS